MYYNHCVPNTDCMRTSGLLVNVELPPVFKFFSIVWTVEIPTVCQFMRNCGRSKNVDSCGPAVRPILTR